MAKGVQNGLNYYICSDWIYLYLIALVLSSNKMKAAILFFGVFRRICFHQKVLFEEGMLIIPNWGLSF